MAHRDKKLAIQQQLRDKQKYLAAFQEVFECLDSDGSGDLSVEELENHIGDPAISAYFCHLNLDVSNAWEIFKLLDDDESGSVSVEEFVLGCLELRGEAKTFDVARLGHDVKQSTKRLEKQMEKERERILSESLKHYERLKQGMNTKKLEKTMQRLNDSVRELQLSNQKRTLFAHRPNFTGVKQSACEEQGLSQVSEV